MIKDVLIPCVGAIFVVVQFCLVARVEGSVLRMIGEKRQDSSEETVKVHQVGSSPGTFRPKRDIATPFSDTLLFTVDIGGESITLNLKHNYHINGTNPVLVMRNGAVQQENVPSMEDFRFYQDLPNMASIIVKCSKSVTSSCIYELDGTFVWRKETYLLFPKEGRGRNGGTEITYNIQKLNLTDDFPVDYVVPDRENSPRHRRNTNGQRYRRQSGKINYVCELLMVTDYYVYEYWYNKTSPNTVVRVRDQQTKAMIRQYYGFILNEIDLLYRNIQDPDFSISVVYGGLFVSDVPQTDWTYRVETFGVANGLLALENFTDWMTTKSASQGVIVKDHAMLFTGTAVEIRLGYRQPVAGIAYINSMCEDSSTSIVKSRYDVHEANIAAHELGHSFGAWHDGNLGTKSATCTSAGYYIMRGASSRTHPNRFFFSNCSIRVFKENTPTQACLLEHNPDVTVRNETLPSEVYNATAQCTHAMGRPSTICRTWYRPNQYNYSSICILMACTLGNDYCDWTNAATGTTCGNTKMCRNGQCVFDDRAPAVSDNCPFGDYQGQHRFLSNQTCTRLVASQPEQCYKYLVRAMCCASCSFAFADISERCPYGDAPGSLGPRYDERTCAQYIREKPWVCYSNENLCCASCQKIRNNEDSCPYGENMEMIPQFDAYCPQIVRERPYECYYTIGRECCTSCRGILSNQTGCPYGDRVSTCRRENCAFYSQSYRNTTCCGSCSSEGPRGTTRRPDGPMTPAPDTLSSCKRVGTQNYLCYYSATLEGCPRSCREIRRNVTGCEFGDRVSACRKEYCDLYLPEVREVRCCHTCSKSQAPVTGTITSTPPVRTTSKVRTRTSEQLSTRDRTPSSTTSPSLIQSRTTTLSGHTPVGTTPKSTGTCPPGRETYWACKHVSNRKYLCYDETTQRQCCQSCKAIHSGVSGCEFGDRVSACRQDACANYPQPVRDTTCCHACSSSNPGDSRTSTTTVLVRTTSEIWTSIPKDILTEGTFPASTRKFPPPTTERIIPSNAKSSTYTTARTTLKSTLTCSPGRETYWACKHVTSRKYLCYEESTRHQCCQSCSAIYSGNSGCEFGDRINACQKDYCQLYSPLIRDVRCCHTCSSSKPANPLQSTAPMNPTAARDRATTLRPIVTTSTSESPKTTKKKGVFTVNSRNTSSSTTKQTERSSSIRPVTTIVAKTTTRITPKIPDNCPLGPETNWLCKWIPTRGYLCYDESASSQCCKSCSAIQSNIPGCLYGDRSNGCKVENCSLYPSNVARVTCCKTCADFNV